ncbi:S8 family serine peptidase [Lacibacter sp. H407]|uniref:S8 family serine peptidase n=1 Tax=Lacibacter sp. H407 TaxID=3133423 RepID=UPI0030BF17EA
MIKSFLFSLLLLCAQFVVAQKTVTTLHLKSGDLLIKDNMKAETLSAELRKGKIGQWTYTLLSFEKPVTAGQQQALRSMGIELLTYLPDNTYQVRMKTTPQFSQLYQVGVRAMMHLPGASKLGSELHTQLAVEKPDGIVSLNLQLHPGVQWNEVFAILSSYGVSLTKSDYLNQGLAQVNIASKNIAAISELPFVAYLNLSFLQPTTLNQRERGLFGLTNLTSSEVAGRSLTGNGTVIGIGDDSNPLHLDNTNKVINRNPSYISKNHGRLVTGVVGGDGLIEERFKGAAPNSLLIVDFFDYVLTKSATYFTDHGMTVTNNSYFTGLVGCPGNAVYNELSSYVDRQINSNPFLQHIFAAGNDGQRTCSPYPLSFATIKSGYQVSKNVLDVADYANSTDNLNTSSSRGPVEDGRIKPEITASGGSILTTSSNNTYTNGFGTSFSSPFVTGVWALLTERYKQLHANALPKSGLLKAIICNTGDDRGNAGPDYSYGFGFINPRKAVEAIENNRYFTGSLSTSGTSTQIIAIPAGTRQVKVMLYWHDKEGSPLAATALVNDLDLTVTDGATTYEPWILNPAPGSVNTPATRGVDRINNIEQVTIDNPGISVTINLSGFNIPNGPQEYFVTYEYLLDEIKLEHPYGGERFAPDLEEIIKWNATDNSTNTFTLEYSIDDGANWIVINNNIAANQHRYRWIGVPNNPTNKGKVRISRNGGGASATSPGNFTILAQPVLTATVPCEGYVNLSWPAVTSATDYEVLQLVNSEFISLGTTNLLNHRVSGLDKTQTYWFTVRARMTDSLGMRAVARSVTPILATACSAAEFDNDLKIDSLLSPVHGRQNTSTALSVANPITVRIKNLDNITTSGSYDISYQVNGGTIVTESSAVSIPAGGTVNYTFAATANLAATGNYTIRIFVKQTGDTQTANDELTYTVKHVANPAVVLPFAETFEATGSDEYKTNFFSLSNADRFDYTNTINGRLRTFVNSGVAISGNKAITLDAINYNGVLANNSITATINLSSYTAAQGLRFDFKFKNHGQLKQPASGVWMRGTDTDPWVQVYDLINNQGNRGETKQVSININELGQPVGTSFQVRFDQQSTTSANNGAYNIDGYDMDDGFTFDDIRILQTNNDLLLTRLVAPDTFNCTPGNANITVRVKNTTSTTYTNVPVYYRINNGTAVAGSVPSLAGNTELDFTFPTQANLSASQAYEIDAWVQLSGDDYPVNDSINNRYVYSSPSISSFPYLERFNTSNGNWFTDTLSYSSWRWGTPEKSVMNRSASEGKGWFTTLNSVYKQNENSYLYSPCFNLSMLTQPVLSFSHISQQEDNCNCDFHTLEYSVDNGNTWQRLTATNGTNWFDSSANQSWRKNIQRWHVSSTEVPNAANVRFRFFLSSDELTQGEGIGIDDIHIFDKATIYTGVDVLNINQTVSGNNWVHFSNGGNLVASIHPMGQNLGSTDVSAYINTGAVRIMNNQYYLDRNLVIRSTNTPTDSVLVRFYFTEQEAKALISVTGCGTCIKFSDAYLAAVTKYNGSPSFENGVLNDGADGTFQFIDSGKVDIVPFNNGYYAEFKVKSFSEFWINAVDMNLTQTVTSVDDINTQGIFIKNVFADEAGSLVILAGNKPQVREMSIRIVNSVGQEVVNKQTSYSDTRININNLSTGIYFVEIKDKKGKEQFVKKIVKAGK